MAQTIRQVADRAGLNALGLWTAQRGHLFPWVPVALACGIALYFATKVEPDARDYLTYLGLGAAALLLRRWAGYHAAPLLWAITLVAAGASIAGWRAHMLAEPVLGWRYYGNRCARGDKRDRPEQRRRVVTRPTPQQQGRRAKAEICQVIPCVRLHL
ncbi:MAG: hypothetical protein AAF686_05465, partial [Pseudomonadota bacterium]